MTILEHIRDMMSTIGKPRILAIDIGAGTVRGVVVKREKGSIIIQAAGESEIPDKGKNIAEGIKHILENMEQQPRLAVIVSSEAIFLDSELPVGPDVKLSSDKLMEAVRWEVEPYLDFPLPEGLFNYYLQKGNNTREKSKTRVLVTSMRKEAYKRLTAICRKYQLSLSRVYTKESAFAFATANSIKKGENKIVIDMNRELASAALMGAEGPIAFQQATPEAMENGSACPIAVETLVSDLMPFSNNTREIVISSENAPLAEAARERLSNKIEIPVRLWKLEDDIGSRLVQPEKPTGERITHGFAGAIGAALLELGLTGGRSLGVTDRVPLDKKIKTKVHIFPLILAAAIATGVMGHYFYIKSSLWRYSSDIKKLKEEKGRYNNTLSEWEGLKKQTQNINEKIRYVKEVLPARNMALLHFLEGIAVEIPDDLILDNLSQEAPQVFILEGSGLSAASITSFVMKLGKLEACRETKLEAINEKETGNKGMGMFLYEFRIKAVLKGE